MNVCNRYQANNCPICRAPFRALLQIRAVQKQGQVTHPAALADADVAQEGVPPGYQCVSLIEALNGPQSLAPPPNPANQVVPVAAEKKRRSRAKKSKRSGNGSSSSSGQAGSSSSSNTATRSERVIQEEDAQSAPVTADEAAAAEATSSPSSARQRPSTAGKVSLQFVNETSVDNNAGNDQTPKDGTSLDMVEEELAKMAVAESLEDLGPEDEAAKAVVGGEVEDIEDEDVEDDADHTVVVNVSSGVEATKDETSAADGGLTASALAGTRRISIPGTPTSIVSVRSSQDSASSSSSSTKLLPATASSQPAVVVGPAASAAAASSAPPSAGSAVIVKVHPSSPQLPDDEEC